MCALAQLRPQNHRPGQLAAHIASGITWGGLAGDGGHRKGQLRVLGSPSALHTKEPRTGGHLLGAASKKKKPCREHAAPSGAAARAPAPSPPGAPAPAGY
jgi:hypothetical protein